MIKILLIFVVIVLLVFVVIPAIYFALPWILLDIGLRRWGKNGTKRQKHREFDDKKHLMTELMTLEQYFKKRDNLDIVKEKFTQIYGWDDKPIKCVEVTYWITERELRS